MRSGVRWAETKEQTRRTGYDGDDNYGGDDEDFTHFCPSFLAELIWDGSFQVPVFDQRARTSRSKLRSCYIIKRCVEKVYYDIFEASNRVTGVLLMEHVEGQTEFARLLASFRERARINLTELAKRLEVSRITVYRWEHGTFPKKESLAKFKAALRWADANSRVRYLDDSEVLKLRIAAGYLPSISTSQQMDQVEPADRCVAYSIRYSPSAFPSRWSWRVMEVEESRAGGVNTMWRGLPSITRPAAFYTSSYYRSHYESGLLDAYAEAHKKRQELFERRLKDSPVQHIYERSQVEDYFTGDSPEPRLKSMRDFASAQIKQVLTWLQRFPDTFDVALTSRSLPANITIVANEVVLLEFPQWSNLSTTGGNLMGLEIFGSGAVLRFKDQFEAIWHDKNTTRERKDVTRQLESLLKNRPAVGRGS